MPSEVSTAGADQDLGRLVEELKGELSEAHRREAATADVLEVISRSKFDLQPVFETIVQSGLKLFTSATISVALPDGDMVKAAAVAESDPARAEAWRRRFPFPLTREYMHGVAILDRRVVDIADVEKASAELAAGARNFLASGYRAVTIMPMMRGNVAIGALSVVRLAPGPLSDKQLAALKTFADQAVIAIENTRLFEEVQARTRELTEALEQQTATSDVLGAISRSKFELQPVLNTLVTSAAHLCDAPMVAIHVQRDASLPGRARYGFPAEMVEALSKIGQVMDRGSLAGRTIAAGRPVHIPDVEVDAEYSFRDFTRITGARSMLGVPLLRDGRPVGLLSLYRTRVAPFTPRQIELMSTFADQAVIAIENTRLFEEVQARTHELQESLDYQTATGGVLNVISRSKFDLQPVLDALAESAAKLCEAEIANIWRAKGTDYRLAASYGITSQRKDWLAYKEYLAGVAYQPGRGSVVGRTLLEGRTIQIDDIRADPDYDQRGALAGVRTMLGVPLLRDGKPIGVMVLVRGTVRRFTDKQVELIETFADQAVIAIENTRLFEEVQARNTELRVALEQQTATSELLKVIGRSTLDLQPVFETLAENAVRLCEAERAFVHRFDGQVLRIVAAHNISPELRAFVERNPITPGRHSVAARAALERRSVHIHDVLADPDLTYGGRAVDPVHPVRTMLAVPMLRADELLGVIMIYRHEVRPFDDSQIALIETFADQAVIAIENTRLFEEVQARTREVTEALEYQTATGDVLSVISRSPSQLQPVLDVIVETAGRLCRTEDAQFFQLRDGKYHLSAASKENREKRPEFLAYLTKNPIAPGQPGSVTARAAVQQRTVHIPDVFADPDYGKGPFTMGGSRSVLAVPLLLDGVAVGVITMARTAAGPFSDKEIRLVTTFADQALIAIENTRLFEEVQARTRELSESLEYQTATSDVLGVISRSPNELQPVLDAIVETAFGLCPSDGATIMLREADRYRFVAGAGFTPEEITDRKERAPVPVDRGSVVGRVALEGRTIHVHDVKSDPDYTLWPSAFRLARRTALGVPLVRDGSIAGVIILFRTEVEPYSQRQIELVETFADQAVIAMNNARLFEEVQARNRDLTALGDVGRAVSSTLDLKVVLKTVVERAVNLSGTDGGSIFYHRQDLGTFELGEATGLEEEVFARFRKLDISTTETGLGEAIAKRQPLQFPDVTKRASNPLRDAALEAGLRAALIVPLLGGEGPLGTLVLWRRQPGEFSAAVVSLMQSFADQSVIALENARLFEEIAQKGRELEIASQHKSQFVANMSHELRTPLAAILGYAELIQEGFYEPQGPKSLDALTRIRSNGKHLLGLINTVLDIAKIEFGQFTLNMAEYAIESVVETVRSATESLAQNKKLMLKTEVAKSLPIGVGDEQRLTQVLLNLVGNAIKFTDAGEVRVTAKAVNGHFAVSVADTGPGIPEQELTRIFDQFHQVDGSLTKAKGGTGLGLAIAKQIVEMHGGRIWVELTLDKGATFQMELPVRAEFRKGTS